MGALGSIIYLVILVAIIAAGWKIFTKAGEPGWAIFIPFYNTIVLFRITGRSHWWLIFIPFVNIYVSIRMVFDLARVFGRGVGFGFGLLFLSPIFVMLLGFGPAEYVGPNGKAALPYTGTGFAPAPTA